MMPSFLSFSFFFPLFFSLTRRLLHCIAIEIFALKIILTVCSFIGIGQFKAYKKLHIRTEEKRIEMCLHLNPRWHHIHISLNKIIFYYVENLSLVCGLAFSNLS
jgi:hypothetical protein